MTIVQFPNKFLSTMLVAWLASRVVTGYPLAVANTIFFTAGIIWSYEEIIHGVNRFRKVLGVFVLTYLVGVMIMAIGR